MASLFVRRAVSACLLLCLWGAAWVYLSLPTRTVLRKTQAPQPEAATVSAFHQQDRLELRYAEPIPPGPCTGCHGVRPHWRDRAQRAFLNLHGTAMDCGTCHLHGPDLAVRRFRASGVVTGETLADGVGGRLYAARPEGGVWTPLLAPTGSAEWRPQGPRCSECHRRKSPVLAGDGLYDPYRRRVLEDLAVLRRLGEATW